VKRKPILKERRSVQGSFHGVDAEGFEIRVGDQSVRVGPTGFLQIPNVTAPDDFGPGGPGTPRDNVSDDCVQITGSGLVEGRMMYLSSAPFRILQNQTVEIDEFFLSETPLALLESLRLQLASPTLGLSQDPSQVAVFAGLSDGTEQDVTGSPCTTYRTSNPDILLVDSTGLVSPTGVGTAIITATRLGAVSAIRVTVTESDARTTVEGFVRRADGTSVANAEVSLAGVAGTAMTDAQGQFAIANVAADTRRLLAIAEKTEDGTTLLGLTEGLAPVSGGVTDAGVIVLSSVCDAIGGTCQDTDGDCIPDNLEAAFGFSATNPDSNANGIPDGQEDPDAETLGICAELFLGTEPLSMDTDGDGLDDAQELALGLNPNDGDEDGDGIPDGQNDADGDGFANAIELNLGSNPLDPRSIPATFNTSRQVTYRFYRPSTGHDSQTLGVNPPLTYRFYPPSVAHDTQALGLPQELSYNRQ